jgi:hypothetical protein
MLSIQPGDSKLRSVDALMPVHAAIATLAFIATVCLMRMATNSLKRDAIAVAQRGPKEDTSARSQTRNSAELPSQGGQCPSDQASLCDSEAESDLEEGGYDGMASMGLLRQIAKLARTAEYVCFAVAFACYVAPLLLLWGLQDLLRPLKCKEVGTEDGLIEEEVQLLKKQHPTDEGYLGTAEGVAMFVVSLLLGAALVFYVQATILFRSMALKIQQFEGRVA